MAYESVTTPSGIVVCVDRVSGKDLQAFKLDVGADGAISGPVSAGNPLPVRRGPEVVVAEDDLVWASGAVANTEKHLDVDLTSAVISPFGVLNVIVRNPSDLTALHVVARKLWTKSAVDRYARAAEWESPADGSANHGVLTEVSASGLHMRISAINTTDVETGGLTAAVQVSAY